MTDGFQPRRRRGAPRTVIATFSAFEGDLLRSLASQLVELLRDEAAVPLADRDPFEALLDFSGPTTPPDDPVLARLLPSAYRGDDEAAGEFRRFTEGQLRSGKAGTAAAVIDALEEAGLPAEPDDGSLTLDIELDRAQALAWMRTITDMRLAIGTRLGVTDDDEDYWEALPDDDPRGHVHDIYTWLAFLQETLVQALTD